MLSRPVPVDIAVAVYPNLNRYHLASLLASVGNPVLPVEAGVEEFLCLL